MRRRSKQRNSESVAGGAVLPLLYISRYLLEFSWCGFWILPGLAAMGEFAVLARASSCGVPAPQPPCTGRSSSTARMLSMEVVVAGRRVQNPGTQLTWSWVQSRSRCGDFARWVRWGGRGIGNRVGSNGRTSVAARAQEQSESGVNWMHKGSPYSVLGVSPDCSEEDIKVAFRNRIKEFHPDVYKGTEDADAITQRIIRAYEMLTNESVERIYRRKNMDPFEEPECEAEDVFVFEMNCIGRGCPYPCAGRAPDIFKFAADTGCARAASQRGPGQGEDYDVQLAVGQCPRNCIYWVTPMQREVLENLMERALEGTTYSSEVVTLEALITRANYENGRYRPPKQKRQPTSTDQWVDWF